MITVHNLGSVGSVLYLAIENPRAALDDLYALLKIDTATFTFSVALPIVGDELTIEECRRIAGEAGAR